MNRFLKRIGVLYLTILLIGCNLTTPTPEGTTLCSPGQLTAPALNAPAMWSVVGSLNPTLSWLPNDSGVPYPYDVCSPAGYRVRLSQGPDFDTDLGAYTYTPFVRNWTPSTPLQPGKEYSWAVSALSDFSVSSSGEGPIGGSFYFFTGPMCDESALLAPRQLEPANGTVVTYANPLLTWEYREACLPPGYRIDLATEPTFSDTSLSGGTGNPSTRWVPGRDLMDCTWYYWRVAAASTGGTLSEFSPVRSFLVDLTDSCVYPDPTLVSIIIPPPVIISVTPVLPIFTLLQNANCRNGPGVVFEARRSYIKDDVLKVKGINDTHTWIMVWMPNEGENFCWVSLSTGTLNTDPNSLPEEQSPPTPVPTQPQNNGPQYKSCGDYTTQALCKLDPEGYGCYWGQNNSCVSNKP